MKTHALSIFLQYKAAAQKIEVKSDQSANTKSMESSLQNNESNSFQAYK